MYHTNGPDAMQKLPFLRIFVDKKFFGNVINMQTICILIL